MAPTSSLSGNGLATCDCMLDCSHTIESECRPESAPPLPRLRTVPKDNFRSENTSCPPGRQSQMQPAADILGQHILGSFQLASVANLGGSLA